MYLWDKTNINLSRIYVTRRHKNMRSKDIEKAGIRFNKVYSITIVKYI